MTARRHLVEINRLVLRDLEMTPERAQHLQEAVVQLEALYDNTLAEG